jgi:hypothetical protein
MTKASRLIITAQVSPDGLPFKVHGRDAWALLELVKAGPKGCTPIENPGPRWSGYVFNLKRDLGLAIETIHESHGGLFSGTHARYVLRSAVTILSEADQATVNDVQAA